MIKSNNIILNVSNIGLSTLSYGLGIFPPFACIPMMGLSSYLLYKEYFRPDKKLQEVFKTFLADEKTNKIPSLVELKKRDNGFTAFYKMHPSTSTSVFEEHKEQLEQYTNSKIAIEYENGMLKIKAYTSELKSKYQFKVEEHEKEDYIFVGYDLDGPVFISLNTFCHILFGGTTGWGKSTTLNSILTLMLLTKDFNFYLIDHKKTELSKFEKCNKVVRYTRNDTDTENMLREIIKEMDKRNDILGYHSLSDIGEYNERFPDKLKRNVIVIDEFAMLSKENHPLVQHILNTGRSAGFHLIICTLRPSKDVISGDMKNNMACRIALKLITDTDSQVILDCNGAEKIMNVGRFLLKSKDIRECQGMFIDSKTIKKTLKHTFTEHVYTKKEGEKERWN